MDQADLFRIIIYVLDIPEEEVTLKTSLPDDLGCDSLDATEILRFVEEKLDLKNKIPLVDIQKIKTVKDIFLYIQDHLQTMLPKKEVKMEKEKLFKLIAEQLDIPVENITPKSSFINDLGADSLDQVELIMAVEEECDISISDDDTEKLKTVKDVWDYISKL